MIAWTGSRTAYLISMCAPKTGAENLSSQATHFKICVDTVAQTPVVNSFTHPDEKKWYWDRAVTLTWEEPEDMSGIDGYYYSIDRRVDTVPEPETALFTQQKSLTFELTEDGLWYFHITAKDRGGQFLQTGWALCLAYRHQSVPDSPSLPLPIRIRVSGIPRPRRFSN